MNDGEKDVYQRTLRWLQAENPNHFEIAEKVAETVSLTYELTMTRAKQLFLDKFLADYKEHKP